MKSIWLWLPVAAAFGLVGCSLNYNDSWGDGEIGDDCEVSADCEAGLSCFVNVCIECDGACHDDGEGGSPSTSSSGCTANEQCPAGSFCQTDAGICVWGGTCDCDEQCGDGLTCDEQLGSCVPGEDPEPAPAECRELGTEPECMERADCVPVYTGINCSCGPDCTCSGVEPNCVCERFDYFACDVAG